MRDVIVVAGHTNVPGTDQGAIGNGFIEGHLAVELKDMVISELSKLGIKAKTDSNKNALAQTLQWLKTVLVSNKTICVDIHWNASGTADSKGTEVIVPDQSSEFEDKIAYSLLRAITDFGFKSRGVKPEAQTARKRLGWMRPAAENVLIEVCFITNPTDMKLYQANKTGISRRIAQVLRDYANK